MKKLLRYTYILYNWKIKKNARLAYAPEDISVELTNICNFKCKFCLQSDPKHLKTLSRTTLSSTQADILLTKLRKGGVKTDVIHWTLDGEPFLNNEIGEICSIAIKHGFKKFIFSTNGYFCTLDRLDKLPKGDNVSYTLCVDFCADKEFYETHRGTPDSWEQVKTNLLLILGNSSYNHLSLKLIDISSFIDSNPVVLKRKLEKLKDIFTSSDRLAVHSRIFHNATGFIPGIKERKQSISRLYNLCPYPWTSLVIASNGDVVGCCRDLQHKTVLGNLFNEELISIWNGEKYQDLRRKLVNKSLQTVSACKDCDLPYDQGKFTFQNILHTAVNRLGLFRVRLKS